MLEKVAEYELLQAFCAAVLGDDVRCGCGWGVWGAESGVNLGLRSLFFFPWRLRHCRLQLRVQCVGFRVDGLEFRV